MPVFKLFRFGMKKKNRLNFGIEDVSQKNYAMTKRRSLASFLFIASHKHKPVKFRYKKYVPNISAQRSIAVRAHVERGLF